MEEKKRKEKTKRIEWTGWRVGNQQNEQESPVLSNSTKWNKWRRKNHFHNFSAFLFTWENNTQIHFFNVLFHHRWCCSFFKYQPSSFFCKCNTHIAHRAICRNEIMREKNKTQRNSYIFSFLFAFAAVCRLARNKFSVILCISTHTRGKAQAPLTMRSS